MLLGSALLALLVAAAFLVLVHAISTLRTAAEDERHANEVTAAALRIEKLVVDLETGLRGLVITRNAVFLGPWSEARRLLPAQLAEFERLTRADERQHARAQQLVNAIEGYQVEYSEPLVAIARERPAAASTEVATAEGARRLNAIRNGLERFLRTESVRVAAASAEAEDRARIAIGFGLTALGLCVVFVVLFGFYLARSIAQPVHAVALGASRLAAGELDVRLAETGPGEVGELTRSFNRMAEALRRNRAELEEQNERLRESEQLKTELIAIVSHELRTPLASMLGFAALLLNREVDEETRRHYLEIIDQQGKRLATLLDDFLSLQRLEEGRLEFASVEVDVTRLLREQANLYSASSDQHRLELRVPGQPLPVRGDPDRLAQVVGNLLSNAIKYSPAGGRVEIAAHGENGTVRFSVRDEGLGIPEEQQELIFTKFFRGNAAASGISGSGLGLAFARAVVEAHGGSISFTSESGKGSEFVVELPAHRGAGSDGSRENGA
jgi:signal transduction histidine kinase